jgi:hypothetical protein
VWSAVQQLGDEGVCRTLGWMLEASPVPDHAAHLCAFAKRATLRRRWQLFMENNPDAAEVIEVRCLPLTPIDPR